MQRGRLTVRNEFVRFLVKRYYDDDASKAAAAVGYAKHQIDAWLDGSRTPQLGSIDWLIHGAVAAEFMVIVEYKPIQPSPAKLMSQLKTLLAGHEKASGIYAFYDSMANLVYVGKSQRNLLGECYQQLNKPLSIATFPKGAIKPGKRRDVVRYLSAYFVRDSDHQDHAKHIESLLLRISKPRLNKNIGKLAKVEVAP